MWAALLLIILLKWGMKFCCWKSSTVHAMVAVCCAVYDQHFHGTFWVGMPTQFEKLVRYHSRKLNLSQDVNHYDPLGPK